MGAKEQESSSALGGGLFGAVTSRDLVEPYEASLTEDQKAIPCFLPTRDEVDNVTKKNIAEQLNVVLKDSTNASVGSLPLLKTAHSIAVDAKSAEQFDDNWVADF